MYLKKPKLLLEILFLILPFYLRFIHESSIRFYLAKNLPAIWYIGTVEFLYM